MLKIGASLEIDIGETQFQFGHQMIWKKSFALAQLKNYKSFLVAEKSLIYTEKVLIISLFHQSKVKEF
jgi:hypothetical protein